MLIKRAGRKLAIPFGPFLAAAALVYLFLRRQDRSIGPVVWRSVGLLVAESVIFFFAFSIPPSCVLLLILPHDLVDLLVFS